MQNEEVDKLLSGLNPVIADAIRPHLKGDWTSPEKISVGELAMLTSKVEWQTATDLDAKIWQIRMGRLIVHLLSAYSATTMTDSEDQLALAAFLLRRLVQDEVGLKRLILEKKK